jgi:hypothetical protein
VALGNQMGERNAGDRRARKATVDLIAMLRIGHIHIQWRSESTAYATTQTISNTPQG